MNLDQKYVHNNIEVKLTGRVAIKRKQSGRNAGKIISKKVEITPANENDGTFKMWVSMSDLHEIYDEDINDAET